MTVADALMGARDYIRAYGWRQGSTPGPSPSACRPDLRSRRCVLDALTFVAPPDVATAAHKLLCRVSQRNTGVALWNDEHVRRQEDVDALLHLAYVLARDGVPNNLAL